MANRDFRKNLSLLCALAGGVAALSSINVPASAMEEPNWETMKSNTEMLMADFEGQYNQPDLSEPKDIFQLFFDLKKKYKQLVPEYLATEMARAAINKTPKSELLTSLYAKLNKLKEHNINHKIPQLEILINELQKTAIN